MNILLDTHILVWWSDNPQFLSRTAYDFLHDTNNTLFVSIASVWEMQIKISLGKLTPLSPLPEMLHTQQQINGIQILPIELRHVYALAALPPHHRDPFDRLLIAQAQSEAMPLLTADAVFAAYNVSVLN